MGVPVGYTCTDIDLLKSELKEIYDLAENISRTSNEHNISGEGSEIKYLIKSALDQLEDLRNSNEALRNWGHQLEENLAEANQEISDLEDNLKEKTDELSTAYREIEEMLKDE